MAGRAPQNAYLSTQIKTASKEQLLMMLFDGAIRFAHQAKAAIDARQIEATSNYSIKVQNIVNELMSSLDQEMISPELYSNLMSLYAFVHKRMVAANIERNAAAVDEAVEILNNLRNMWRDAIETVFTENGGKMPELTERPVRSEPPKVADSAPRPPVPTASSPQLIAGARPPHHLQSRPAASTGRLAGAHAYAGQAVPGQPTGLGASQKFPLPQEVPTAPSAPTPPPSTQAAAPRPSAPGRPAFAPPAPKSDAPPAVAPPRPEAPDGGLKRPKININKK